MCMPLYNSNGTSARNSIQFWNSVQNPQNGNFTNTFPNAFTNGQTVRTSVTKASVVDADIYNQSFKSSFSGVQFRASVWSFRP